MISCLISVVGDKEASEVTTSCVMIYCAGCVYMSTPYSRANRRPMEVKCGISSTGGMGTRAGLMVLTYAPILCRQTECLVFLSSLLCHFLCHAWKEAKASGANRVVVVKFSTRVCISFVGTGSLP